MHIQIMNKETGELVEFRTELGSPNAHGLKAIRGVIRQWMKNNLDINDFVVHKCSDWRLYKWLRKYAWELAHHQCDVCRKEYTNSELHYIDDSEGVCIMVLCKDCGGN